jgi:DNA-binding transcriptional regulator YiaG
MFTSMTKEEVKALRLSLGFTQQQLADELGCAQQRIAEWETGKKVIGNAYQRLLKQIKPK